jgi:AsmA protein
MNPSRRPLRIILLAVAAVLVLAIGAGAVLIARFDPNEYKPDIVQAAKRATGRDLALNGKISLKPSLWPTIEANDVAFSNPPGFSRPQMVTLQSMELRLGLLALLSRRFEIDRLILIHPDILLETDAAGHANWQFTPEVSPAAPAGSQPPAEPGHARTDVSVATIRILDGSIAYRDGATAKVTTLGLPKLEATAASPDSPLHLAIDAIYNGTVFNLTGDTGSLTRLQDPTATTPWPVKLALTLGAAKLNVDGALTQPMLGKGYDLALDGAVPDAAALTPLLAGFVPTGFSVPALHDVRFAAKVADKGGPLPEFSSLMLHAGASDLSARMPGLTLDHLDLAAAATGQPVKADAAGKLDGQPVSFAATGGALAALMPNAKPAPFPLDATLQAAGATISVKGSIANAQALTGVSLVLAAHSPDLSALSPFARHPLPAIKQVAFQATLTEGNGGLRNGVALHGLTLTSADGDLAGDAAISLGARKSLMATLKSNRIDLDALQSAISQTQAASPQPGAAPPQPGAVSPPPPKRSDRLFSDQPIPFDLLRAADADLTLTIAALRSGGADIKAITAHAVVANGKLAVDPFAADLPGGHLAGTLAADAAPPAPPVHIVLRAPGLALKSILAAAHYPAIATGNLEIYADLHGTGTSPHAIAASLDGTLGLAVAGGSIDNRLLGDLLGKLLNELSALNLVGKGGGSELKCFAMRMEARNGTGAIRALALSSSLLTMTGSGTVNLGAETLALALRPQAKLARTDVVIPVAVSGPIRDPSIKVNDLAAAEANAGTVAGVVVGNATPLGIVGGLLGADKLLSGGTPDMCPAALAAARGQPAPAASGQPGTPAHGTPNPGVPNPGPANPGALLKNLFR